MRHRCAVVTTVAIVVVRCPRRTRLAHGRVATTALARRRAFHQDLHRRPDLGLPARGCDGALLRLVQKRRWKFAGPDRLRIEQVSSTLEERSRAARGTLDALATCLQNPAA